MGPSYNGGIGGSAKNKTWMLIALLEGKKIVGGGGANEFSPLKTWQMDPSIDTG